MGLQFSLPKNGRTTAILLSVSGLALAACDQVATGGEDAANAMVEFCSSPAAMPSGFDYPQSAETLALWTAERNEVKAREHGWNLFVGLQQDSGGQWTWRSWCTARQAFDGQNAAVDPTGDSEPAKLAATTPVHGNLPMRTFKLDNGLTSGDEPINFDPAPQYAIPQPVLDWLAEEGKTDACVIPASGNNPASLAHGPQFQNNGDVMVAGVIYNQDAYDWIRKEQLYQPATLESLLPASDKTAQIAELPSGSIVLKPMMWPVPMDGVSALPLWDDYYKPDGGQYSGFEIQRQWNRAVAVSLGEAEVPERLTFLEKAGVTLGGARLGPNVYDEFETVGIDQFYHFEPDVGSLDACDRAILDQSAYYAYGRTFQQGDALALVAMHIMTKEQPSWTFQSVWWSDKPDEGMHAANRPDLPNAKGPWRHYLMTSTYGWPEEKGGSTWPIAYNPYIELAAAHPVATNCQNCHARAAWPNASNQGYLAPGGPGALAVFSYDGNPIFNGLIGVDSLWSLSDRVPVPKNTQSAAPSPAP